MPFRRVFTVIISGILTWSAAACSTINPPSDSTESPSPVTQSGRVNSPSKSPSASKNQAQLTISPSRSAQEAYEQALDTAYSAAIIGQSAQSPDDWRLAIARWQDAILLLKSIPSSSSYHKLAQSKITEYQRNLIKSQSQSKLPPTPAPTPISLTSSTVEASPNPSPTPTKPRLTLTPKAPPTSIPKSNQSPDKNTENPKVFKAPIRRLIGDKPVIDVTFNGKQTFEMLVDTATSGTIITTAMAQSLGVEEELEGIIETAEGEAVTLPFGKVKSIAVAGAIQEDFAVAIGNEDLEIGLLGQNFYSHYDVFRTKDAIEFRPRNKS